MCVNGMPWGGSPMQGYTDAAGYLDVKETTHFFDAWSPLQRLQRQATPGTIPVDIVAPVFYDASAEVNNILPYASGTNVAV